MPQKATFYHAGCPVCVSAEQGFAHALDPAQYDVEVVHLGEAPGRTAEDAAAGNASVPDVVLAGLHLHITFVASPPDRTGQTRMQDMGCQCTPQHPSNPRPEW